METTVGLRLLESCGEDKSRVTTTKTAKTVKEKSDSANQRLASDPHRRRIRRSTNHAPIKNRRGPTRTSATSAAIGIESTAIITRRGGVRSNEKEISHGMVSWQTR